MPVSLDDARQLTVQFCRQYPGALRLAFLFRRTTADLYGDLAAGVPASMQGGYLSGHLQHGGRACLGRVDIPVDNIRHADEFVLTLRHEVLGHFGINTFVPREKAALLQAILAGRGEPSLAPIWQHVDQIYADQAELVRAEEVFAWLCEGVQPRPAADEVAQRGAAAFNEVCVSGARRMRAQDLLDIASMVAQGLHDKTREQRNFPAYGELLERLAPQEADAMQTASASVKPALLGPGLLQSLYVSPGGLQAADVAKQAAVARPLSPR